MGYQKVALTLLKISEYTPLSEYFRIVWCPHIYIGAFAILLMYIAVSLIMPLLIIGRSTLKQILAG